MGEGCTHTCVHAYACMCAHAGARQAPLACRVPVFALRLPCAFQGTCGIWQPGMGALRGQGVFCSTHAFIYGCGFDAEKDRAFDVCVRARALQVFHTRCVQPAWMCVCLHMRVCVHVC